MIETKKFQICTIFEESEAEFRENVFARQKRPKMHLIETTDQK